MRRFRSLLHAPALICALVLALLANSSLGLLHRGMHGAASGEAVAAEEGGQTAAGDAWPALFGDHDQRQCHLFDQLTHTLAAPSVPFAFGMLVLQPAQALLCPEGAPKTWIAAFDARGPPTFR